MPEFEYSAAYINALDPNSSTAFTGAPVETRRRTRLTSPFRKAFSSSLPVGAPKIGAAQSKTTAVSQTRVISMSFRMLRLRVQQRQVFTVFYGPPSLFCQGSIKASQTLRRPVRSYPIYGSMSWTRSSPPSSIEPGGQLWYEAGRVAWIAKSDRAARNLFVAY